MPTTSTSTAPQPVNGDWYRWAQTLRRLGLSGLAAALLESGSAFATLASQALYASQPLISPWIAASQTETLARLLEDPQRSREFARLLREEPQ